MSSIITNSSAMSALSVLRSIDNQMDTVQNRISSGLRVGSASDNAAYWSIATTMRSDKQALSTVQDALGLAASKVDTAYAGLETAIDIISTIKSKLTTAQETGVDKDKINKELTELKNQLTSVATSASFSGENWLYNTSGTANGPKTMVGSFVRGSDNSISIQTITFDSATSTLIDKDTASRGLLSKSYYITAPGANGGANVTHTYYLINCAATNGPAQNDKEIKLDSTTTNTVVGEMQAAVEQMLKSVTDAASTLGSTKSRIEMQGNFVKTLTDTFAKGIGRLVDADMNEESTRLKALQTQQQLGIQALSIANGSAQNMLQLFR